MSPAEQPPGGQPTPSPPLSPEVLQTLIESRIEDSSARLRFQHEFAIAGFKTLTLINGGAIIGLLTYAGNRDDAQVANHLANAFMAYAAGLALSVLAYLFAYMSQSRLMNDDMIEAYRLLRIEPAESTRGKRYEEQGALWVVAAIVLTLLSLSGFVAGSWLAMDALT